MITYLTLHNAPGIDTLKIAKLFRVTLLEGDASAALAVLHGLMLLSCGARPENLLALGNAADPGRPLAGLKALLEEIAAGGEGRPNPGSVGATVDGQHLACAPLPGAAPLTKAPAAPVRRAVGKVEAEAPKTRSRTPSSADWQLIFRAEKKLCLDGAVRLQARTLVTSWAGGEGDGGGMRFPKTVFLDCASSPKTALPAETLGEADMAVLAKALREALSGAVLSFGPEEILRALPALPDMPAAKGPIPRDQAHLANLADLSHLAHLARLARALYDARGGLLLACGLGEGLAREECLPVWLVLDGLSRALQVQVLAASNPMVYEEAARVWDGREDLGLVHLDPAIAEEPVRPYRGRKFDRGLDDPRRQENPQKAPPRRDAASGRAKTQILPADPYLWVAAGRVRASRGLDDAQTASLPKAAPRPETAAKRARQAADPTDRICAAAREAHADSGPRITRLSLYGPGGLKEVRLEGLGRFTFVECGRAADPAALIEGLLLLAVFRHPGAALRLPAVRGLPQTAGYARDTLYRLVGEAPNAHVTVCADCPDLFAASLAGVGADLPEGLYDGMQHKCAPMRSCGRADAADDCFPLLFRRRGRMFRGTLTLSRKGPAGDWPSQMSDPAVPEICHVDAARPPDGRTARFLGTLSGRRTAILAEVLHGLSPADPGPTPKKLAAFLEASPLSIPLPGARAQVRKRAARLAAALFDACDGVLLVASAGEGLPENGMAADLMPYFRFVEGLARRLNVQIIAFAEPGLHDAALACAQSESGFRRISLDGQNVTPKKKPRAASRRKTCERRIAPPERPGDCGRARPDSPDSSESAGPGPHRPPKRRLLLSSLRLTDFCGFRDCRFTELGPVTVFTGPQGTDPAAPLAACALLSLFRHPQNMTLLCRLRGLPDTPEGRARLLGSLFADSGNRPVRVAGTYAGRLEQDARLTVPVGAEIVLERRAQAGWAAPVLDLTFAEDGVARTGLLSLAGERSAAPAGTSPETPGGTSPKISPETPGETAGRPSRDASLESGSGEDARPALAALDLAGTPSPEEAAAMRAEAAGARACILEAREALLGWGTPSAIGSSNRTLRLLSDWEKMPDNVRGLFDRLVLQIPKARGGILLAAGLDTVIPKYWQGTLWRLLEDCCFALDLQILATASGPDLLRAAALNLRPDSMRLVVLNSAADPGAAGLPPDFVWPFAESLWPGR